MIILGPPPLPPVATRGTVYLPTIFVGAPNPVAEFSRLLVSDPRQERPHLELCASLQQAAVWRAYGMACGADPFAHVDRDGTTPNEFARQAGCRLPADYAARGNNVESICAGTADAMTAFVALANSAAHSDHLFGRGWFQSQRHFGVAMCEGPGVYRWYWCVLCASCGEQTSKWRIVCCSKKLIFEQQMNLCIVNDTQRRPGQSSRPSAYSPTVAI